MKKRLVVTRENLKRMSWCEGSETGISFGVIPPNPPGKSAWFAKWCLSVGYTLNHFYQQGTFTATIRGHNFRPLEGPEAAFLLYPEGTSNNKDDICIITPETPVATLILGDIRNHSDAWEITGGERGFREE